MEGKGTDDQRNEFCWGLIFISLRKVHWFGYMRRLCVIEIKAGNGYPRIGYPLVEAGTDSQITRISGSTNIYFKI